MRDVVFVARRDRLLRSSPPCSCASARRSSARRHEQVGRMSLENAVGLVLAILVLGLPDLRARLPGAARMSLVQLAPARRAGRDPARHDSRPRRLHRRRLRRRRRRSGDRVFLPGRAAHLPRLRRRSDPRADAGPSTRSRCSRSASSPCSASTCCSAIQGVPAARPDRREGRAARARVQHRGLASSPTRTGRTTAAS